jgi:hypothetical protein
MPASSEINAAIFPHPAAAEAQSNPLSINSGSMLGLPYISVGSSEIRAKPSFSRRRRSQPN